MCGDAEDPYPAGGVLHAEEHIQPSQGDGLQVEEVAGDDPIGLCLEELLPGRSRSARRRVQAVCLQDRPHRRGADLVAQARQLAVDPAVPPGGVLYRQPLHQGLHSRRDRRTTRTPSSGGGPSLRDQSTMPAQYRPGRHQQPDLPRRWQPKRERRDHDPVRPRQPRPTGLPTQHRQLVPQQQDLGILRRLRAAKQHQPALWVPETLQQLCGVCVFVEEAAESVVANDRSGRVCGDAGEGSQGCGLAQRSVGSVGVEVLLVLAQDASGVGGVDD
jgi:hypothetical protein